MDLRLETEEEIAARLGEPVIGNEAASLYAKTGDMLERVDEGTRTQLEAAASAWAPPRYLFYPMRSEDFLSPQERDLT